MPSQPYLPFRRDAAARRKAIRSTAAVTKILAEAVTGGCGDWSEKAANDLMLMRLGPRSHASNINDLIWARIVESEFPTGVSLPKLLPFSYLNVGGEYYVRVKKVDHQLFYSNVITHTQDDVGDHDFDGALIHIPKARWLVFGYWFDPGKFTTTGMWLTCQGHRQHYWEPHKIIREAGDDDGEANIPIIRKPPTPPTPRVKVKKIEGR